MTQGQRKEDGEQQAQALICKFIAKYPGALNGEQLAFLDDLIIESLASTEQRVLEDFIKEAEQMRIQACSIRNEVSIMSELLVKIELRINKVVEIEAQLRQQARKRAS